jgi:hypothetical protein
VQTLRQERQQAGERRYPIVLLGLFARLRRDRREAKLSNLTIRATTSAIYDRLAPNNPRKYMYLSRNLFGKTIVSYGIL